MSAKLAERYRAYKKLDRRDKLHPGQSLVFHDPHRFKVLVCGRRWGKTAVCRNMIKWKAAKNPHQRIWYIAPTYRQAKEIMWKELIQDMPRDWVVRKNMTSLEMELVNGSIISLKGADDPDNLRGVALHYVVFDEVQKIDPYVWEAVVQPMLSTTGGGAAFVGTPDSYGFLYDLYQKGQDEDEVNWKSWQFVTADSPFVPDEEVEIAKSELDPRIFDQEYMATFLSMTGKVYHCFDRHKHVGHYPFDPNLPVWVAQDFNVNPMTTVIMQYHRDIDEIWVVDEITKYRSNVEEVVEEIERRYWRHKQNTVIFPDPAIVQTQHARGETNVDIFVEKGYTDIRFRKRHPAQSDRINCMNRMMLNARGDVRFRVDSTCRDSIKSLERTMYREDKPEIDKTLGTEHWTDGMGYLVEYMFPMRQKIIMGTNL